MVAGKSSQAALARKATAVAPKLPPLPTLRVRRPITTEENPCLTIMSSMLGCWASHGQGGGCVGLEDQLRSCMNSRQRGAQTRSNINADLARFKKQIEGPRKIK